jgi:hypothetical protein
MKFPTIDRVLELDVRLISHLVEESLSQEFRFVERFVQQYCSGANRFDCCELVTQGKLPNTKTSPSS